MQSNRIYLSPQNKDNEKSIDDLSREELEQQKIIYSEEYKQLQEEKAAIKNVMQALKTEYQKIEDKEQVLQVKREQIEYKLYEQDVDTFFNAETNGEEKNINPSAASSPRATPKKPKLMTDQATLKATPSFFIKHHRVSTASANWKSFVDKCPQAIDSSCPKKRGRDFN